MNKLALVLSVVTSIAALAIAIRTYTRADAIADAALRRREQQLVESLWPKLRSIYEEFELERSPDAPDPKSLDELFAPMVQLVAGLKGNAGMPDELE